MFFLKNTILLLPLLSFVTLSKSQTLKACDALWTEEEGGNICKIDKKYSKLYFPQPSPCHIQSDFRILEVAGINEEQQTITIVMQLDFEWNDTRIDYHFASNEQEDVYHPYHVLDEKYAADIWYPESNFLESVDTQMQKGLGRGSLWYKHPSRFFMETKLKLTLACQMNFNQYPFDTHLCPMHLASYMGKKSLIIMDKPSIYSNQEFNQTDHSSLMIKDGKLRFDLVIESKESMTINKYGDAYSWAHFQITLTRKSSESKYLWGSYFGVTLTFSVLSLASFSIKIEKVPGRIGLLITLLLISINTYNSLHAAPVKRGISFVEIWFIGMVIPIIGAILEYAFLLCLFKYEDQFHAAGLMDQEKDLYEWYKKVDSVSLTVFATFLISFNAVFWLVSHLQ